MRARRRWLALLVAGAALLVVIELRRSGPDPARRPAPPPALTPTPSADGHFRVSGGRIVDPSGRPFVVKGVVIPYGTFAGGPGGGPDPGEVGPRNFADAQRDFRRLRRLGVNLVRVFGHPDADRARVRAVIGWARAEGLVVEITNAGKDDARGLPWITDVAREHRDDPYVWPQPVNEPNCAQGPPTAECGDWATWQREQRAYVSALRAAGVRAPIVINGPSFSWDLSRIEQYPLDDGNLVFGAHRYANDQLAFDDAQRRQVDDAWADLAGDHAVIVDEVGAYNGPEFANSLGWAEGFLDYVADWIRNRGGSGAIGFTWRWYDGNSLTDEQGALTPWGSAYERFLRRIDATPPA